MKLQEALKEHGVASIEREAESGKWKDTVTATVFALVNRNAEQSGKYQIQLRKGMNSVHETIDCESYEQLVAALLSGEADSDQWIDM